MKTPLLALLLALCLTPGLQAADKPAGEKKPGAKAAGRGGMLPDKIEGVTEAELSKYKAAMAKAIGDENVKAAREHLADLKGRAEFASADEKKSLRKDFETAIEDVRKATREALMKADKTLTREVIDKIQDAIEDQMKQRAAENGKGKKKAAAPGEKKAEDKTETK